MKGLSPVWAWRVGFALLGAVSYFGAALLLARELVQIAGSNETRLRRMTWTIYFAGGLTACLAGVWNPMGWKLVLISAAASSFGGASGLLWIPSVASRCNKDTVSITNTIPRLQGVLIATAVLLALYVWFLGRGIRLG
jgi:hypothetical protein